MPRAIAVLPLAAAAAPTAKSGRGDRPPPVSKPMMQIMKTADELVTAAHAYVEKRMAEYDAKTNAGRLQSFVQRIERLEKEKAGIADAIKTVKTEAKEDGFDVKVLNEIIKLRKMDAAQRKEYEDRLDEYKAALGMLYDTPLGEAAQPHSSVTKEEEARP